MPPGTRGNEEENGLPGIELNPLLAIAASAGLLLSGCCTRPATDDFSRFDGTGPQHSGMCGIFSGFGTTDAPERWTAVYSPAGVSEYGDLLCGHLEPEEYATCVNDIWDHYRRSERRTPEPGESTSGPFAVVVWGEVFLGSYRSDPFSAGFRVSNDRLSCRGADNAFLGSANAVFDVYCDNGKRGKADIVLDRDGRNGIGQVIMDDGTVGKVVFGHATVGGALATMGI